MMKNLALLGLLMMMHSIVWSQNSSNSLARPMEFDGFVSDDIAAEYFNGGDLSRLTYTTGKTWKVVCSQKSTPVLQEPKVSSELSELQPSIDFREQAIVTKVKKDWLQIKTRNSENEPIGWVHSSNFLLSPYALKTSGGVGRKALVVPNLENQSNTETELTRTQLYSHPNLGYNDVLNGRRAGLFRVLYVYKETSNCMLLGVTPTIEEGSAGSVLLGWMPKQYLTEWNRRVAYGPVYGEFEEVDVGTEIPFFQSKELLGQYESSCTKLDAAFKLTVPQDPLIPLVPAFPDVGESMRREIENKQRELLTIVGASTSPKTGIPIINIQKNLRALKDKLGNVNLLFIVDATASMGRYFPEIAKSISEINEWSTDWGGEVEMRVGFGFYRDYPDGPDECWNQLGNEIVSYDPDMAQTIRGIPCKSKGTNRPEAVYQGIIKNLESWNPDPNESNIVILIGDEGNHRLDPKFNAQQVSIELERINASLFAFQATAFLTESSMRFQSDVLLWMDALKMQNEDDGIKTTLERIEPGVIGFDFEENKSFINTRRAKLITQASQVGAKTNPSLLAQKLKTDIETWIDKTQGEIDRLDNLINGTGIVVDEVERENFIQLLIQQGFTRAQAITFLDRGGDIAIRRFASVENCEGKKWMTPYVFMTLREYNNISEAFDQLKAGGTQETKKKALKNMCVSLIQAQVGKHPDQYKPYLQKTMGEIWIEFFQVDFNIPSMKDVSVAGITALPDADFDNAYESLLTAHMLWKDLVMSDHEWRIARASNAEFYWVPATYFPGFEN